MERLWMHWLSYSFKLSQFGRIQKSYQKPQCQEQTVIQYPQFCFSWFVRKHKQIHLTSPVLLPSSIYESTIQWHTTQGTEAKTNTLFPVYVHSTGYIMEQFIMKHMSFKKYIYTKYNEIVLWHVFVLPVMKTSEFVLYPHRGI